MLYPTTPDPSAVARGTAIVERELSTLPPRSTECIRSILRMLDAAYELLCQPTDDRNPSPSAAAGQKVDGSPSTSPPL